MLLTLLFTCLAFSVLASLDFSIGRIGALPQGYNLNSSHITNHNPGQEACIAEVI
jgi:hypothetical protein